MVCVGIDVAKDKHDCCILDSDGMVRADCFTIPNNMDGFKQLLQTIRNCTKKSDKIKVGLEATGHYSYNILGFLLDNGLPTYVINPLHTNLYRKSLSLRKTKTDRVDARTIATMLFLYFPDGVDDIHPPLLVQPAVLDRQAHAVQQDAVQRPGIGGELPEAVVLEQCFRDAEVGEQLARLTIKVVQRHLV